MSHDPADEPEDRPTELLTNASLELRGPAGVAELQEPGSAPEPTTSMVSWEPTPLRFSVELAQRASDPPPAASDRGPDLRVWIQALMVVLVLWIVSAALVVWWASGRG
ncbi:MAG TPA: hypothetical protein ENK18_08640 [Deltaproteobacteria bacterium]|nr:hypothetical protein [Deltaproteobacteria bacterium]